MLQLSESSHIKKSKKWTYLWLAIALGLIAYGGVGFWQQYQATHQEPPSKQQMAEVVTHSTDTPDETAVDSCGRFVASDNQPRKIIIPRLEIDSCIQKVGVDQHDAIAVPSNIHVAGWFVDSAIPGESGVSIIDGHAGGRYTNGIFKHLNQLSPDDIIEIQIGDGRPQSFAVISVESYSVKETSREQYRHIEGVESQLTLVTCGGDYDSEQQSYDQRVIVRSRLLSHE